MSDELYSFIFYVTQVTNTSYVVCKDRGKQSKRILMPKGFYVCLKIRANYLHRSCQW